MEYPQVDYGVINHEADCWDAHSQFLAWVRIRDPMLPKVSNRYCNFECFASSEIWHILHQRLYWQRFKHSWILGTTNSFSQYNSISEFGTRLFLFFTFQLCDISNWCLWRCPRPEWTGAAFFQPWCRKTVVGFLLAAFRMVLLSSDPIFKDIFYWLISQVSERFVGWGSRTSQKDL